MVNHHHSRPQTDDDKSFGCLDFKAALLNRSAAFVFMCFAFAGAGGVFKSRRATEFEQDMFRSHAVGSEFRRE